MLWDGAAFSVMVGGGETYLPAFALALGLGQVEAGLLSSLPPLAGAVLQLASPAAVRRLRSHRRWVVICAAIQALSFVPLVAAALAGRIHVGALFAVATVYWASGMSTGPAWNTWVTTLVPPESRARFFARRTRITQLGVLLGLVLGGFLLSAGSGREHELLAYAVLFGASGLFRAASTGLLASQSEPEPMPEAYRVVPVRNLVANLRRSHEGKLLSYMLAVQTAVYVSAGFFSPYMLGPLGLDYERYMALLAVSFAAKAICMPFLGRLAHQVGARVVLWIGGAGIVPVAALWLLSDDFTYLVVIQTLSGLAWAAWELGTMLLVFETIRAEERTSILTSFNLANALAMTLGSLVGGLLLHQLGETWLAYAWVFGISSVLRLATVPLLRRVPDVRVRVVPLATRTVAVRPSSGSLERPVLPSLEGTNGANGGDGATGEGGGDPAGGPSRSARMP